MDTYRYVILGGGMVAGYAARELADHGLRQAELCILSADSALPCERPPLSKKFLAGQKDVDDVLINPPSFYQQHGIDVRLGTTVTRVDLKNRRLATTGGGELGFEKLLIATGTRVRRLQVPGHDLDRVFYLRWLEDSQRIRQGCQDAKRAVIVGGGYIGMETAAVLRDRGLEVTMVFPDDHLLARIFTPEMGEFFGRYYRDRGVTLLTGEAVARFHGSGRLAGVGTRAGRDLPADLAIVGIGVEPVTDIFEGTGLKIDDGIVVNEYLETGVPNVFAAGDVARFPDRIAGRQRRVEHWDNAVTQGRHAGRLLAGDHRPYENLSYFFSDEFDLSWEFWGDRRQGERVVHRGDVSRGRFSAWWLRKDGTVVAAFVMSRPDEEREMAQQWIREKARVRAEALADDAAPLAEIVAQ